MKRLLIIIMLMLAMPVVRAEMLSLEQCVDTAVAHNPSVAAASLSVERQRMLQATAFNPPMTEVTLKQETTGGGGPENGVYFGQEFDFPTLYIARHKSLVARSDLEAGRLNVLLADIRGEVGRLYFSLLYSRELLKLNSRLDTLYTEFCRVASVRLAEGEIGPLELMNATRVREKNQMEREVELSNYKALQRELQTVMGCSFLPEPVEEPFLPVGFSADTVPALGVDIFDFANTSRGRLAAGEIAVAEKEYTEARHEFLPGIRLGATVQALIKSFNPYHVDRLPFEKGNFMGFEVGVTVPLFFGAQSARVKAADAQRRISQLEMQTAESQAVGEVEKLRGQLSSIDARLRYYETTALPQAEEIKRIATVSYELGDISYIEYIANMETAFDIFLEYALCINDHNQTLLRLQSLTL